MKAENRKTKMRLAQRDSEISKLGGCPTSLTSPTAAPKNNDSHKKLKTKEKVSWLI